MCVAVLLSSLSMCLCIPRERELIEKIENLTKDTVWLRQTLFLCFMSFKNKPGTRGRLRKGLQIPMDGLTYWPTDGRRIQYLSEYVLQCKNGTIKILGKLFFKNPRNHFWKKSRSPMEKGRTEFAISFMEPGGNSEQSGNV